MKIFVEPAPPGFRLCVESHGFRAPAGIRLYRGGDWPDIDFFHMEEARAREDAVRLQRYLDAREKERGPSKAKVRKEGAD